MQACERAKPKAPRPAKPARSTDQVDISGAAVETEVEEGRVVNEPLRPPSSNVKVRLDGLGENPPPEIVLVATTVSNESTLPVTEVSVIGSTNVPARVSQPSVNLSLTPTGSGW
jgi:hypothetical protein